LGFNLVAFANNHTLNYGEYGLLATLRALRRAGLVHAGAGRNLAEARMPAYLETPAGRVALLACASTFAKGQEAGEQRPDCPGRPGLNPQRFYTYYVVDEAAMAEIRRIAELTGAEKRRQWRVWMGFKQPPKKEGVFEFLDNYFVVGDEFGIRTEPHDEDLEANTRWIAEARKVSNLVIASIHAHEQGKELWLPADFLVTFAHACIDAGADLFVGHGPHLLRALEIYKGKPIFYSLGNFFFQYEYLSRVPADDRKSLGAEADWTPWQVFKHLSKNDTQSFPAQAWYWETVLPFCVFEDGQLKELTLYPLSLGFKAGPPQRGIPRLAKGELGRRILEGFAELSGGFGTRIRVEDGFARVVLEGERTGAD
jgi:hypothetical protein